MYGQAWPPNAQLWDYDGPYPRRELELARISLIASLQRPFGEILERMKPMIGIHSMRYGPPLAPPPLPRRPAGPWVTESPRQAPHQSMRHQTPNRLSRLDPTAPIFTPSQITPLLEPQMTQRTDRPYTPQMSPEVTQRANRQNTPQMSPQVMQRADRPNMPQMSPQVTPHRSANRIPVVVSPNSSFDDSSYHLDSLFNESYTDVAVGNSPASHSSVSPQQSETNTSSQNNGVIAVADDEPDNSSCQAPAFFSGISQKRTIENENSYFHKKLCASSLKNDALLSSNSTCQVYKCDYCIYMAFAKSQLDVHLQNSKHLSASLYNAVSEMSSVRIISLQKMLAVKNSVRTLRTLQTSIVACPLCRAVFDNIFVCGLHNKYSHGVRSDAAYAICPVIHSQSVQIANESRCLSCRELFTHQDELQQHWRHEPCHHPAPKPKSRAAFPVFNCPLCAMNIGSDLMEALSHMLARHHTRVTDASSQDVITMNMVHALLPTRHNLLVLMNSDLSDLDGVRLELAALKDIQVNSCKEVTMQAQLAARMRHLQALFSTK